MQPDTRYALFLLSASLAKTGIYQRGIDVWFYGTLDPWRSVLQGSNSWLFHVIYHVLGGTTPAGWAIVSATMLLVPMTGLILASRQLAEGNARRSFIALIFASGIPGVVVFSYGLYDALFLLGVSLTLFDRSHLAWVLAGAFIMAGSNPEQALVAGVACAFVGLGLGAQGGTVRRAGAIVGAMALGQLLVLSLIRGNLGGRAAVLAGNLHASLEGHLIGNTVELFSWYGLAWIALVACTWHLATGYHRVVLWLGLLAVPATAALITLDGTRVFVLTSSLAFTQLVFQGSARGNFHLPVLADGSIRLVTLMAVVNPCLFYWGNTHSLWLPHGSLAPDLPR